ncbi:Imidazole glycerol phosphate synthase subunit HisF [Planctomycetes bacterium Pan216]|uniref:imidazole glycerol-phosphate synthase n=1 Tax=Kolteria novifilia TaxID=2527975 RepID=A0A518B3G9_9BACT|nr:Imidazole glycerol phosphate synthase subunit HisF [Planctomycetes bacterium Pan216]
MLKNRLIPVVLLREGVVVQSKRFGRYQLLGNPATIVERLSDWASDELIYLDISGRRDYDLGRDDLAQGRTSDLLSILREISRRCFMPMAFGGGLRTVEDCAERVANGADKVVINTQALHEPEFIDRCAKEFGAQCVVVCIDAKQTVDQTWEVFAERGKRPTGRSPDQWAKECQERGAGEILIQSIDRDGTGQGYDVPLVRSIARAVQVPVIALGGVGQWGHLADGLIEGEADAVSAANIFNYSENSVLKAKRSLFEAGLNVREPSLASH